MACVVPVNPGGPFSMARTPYKLMAVYSEKPIPNTNAEINHCKRTKIQNRLIREIHSSKIPVVGISTASFTFTKCPEASKVSAGGRQ